MVILKGGSVYSPENLGKKDVVIAGGKIIAVEDDVNISGLEAEIIDARGKVLAPGFIDSHVHICGGGGEGGYRTRTPEICLTDITTAGVTTVVGVLGTDGTSRTMSNLLAKAYALEEEGISTFTYTGSYQIPVRTVTGSITDDLILIEKIIGAGEIALSDHRSSCPTVDELIRLVSQARLGGMLSGKAGVVNIHMGDQKEPLEIIQEALQKSSLPITQFYPTHMNRNAWIMEDAVAFGRQGGVVDFTTSTTAQFLEEGEIYCAHAVKHMVEEGVPIEQVTLSSDGQGSLPVFDSHGRLMGLEVGQSTSMGICLKKLWGELGLPLEHALKTITANPARILKLKSKGWIAKGFDGDVVLMEEEDLAIHTVLCKGQVMVRNGEAQVKGTFEK